MHQPTPTTAPFSALIPVLGSCTGCLLVALVAALILLVAVRRHWKPLSLLAIYGYAIMGYLFFAWHLY